jgi:hypothetical protein
MPQLLRVLKMVSPPTFYLGTPNSSCGPDIFRLDCPPGKVLPFQYDNTRVPNQIERTGPDNLSGTQIGIDLGSVRRSLARTLVRKPTVRGFTLCGALRAFRQAEGVWSKLATFTPVFSFNWCFGRRWD